LDETELEQKILEAVKGGGIIFRDLLKKVPEERPLTVKLALDSLERNGEVSRFVEDGRYLFGIAREKGDS